MQFYKETDIIRRAVLELKALKKKAEEGIGFLKIAFSFILFNSNLLQTEGLGHLNLEPDRFSASYSFYLLEIYAAWILNPSRLIFKLTDSILIAAAVLALGMGVVRQRKHFTEMSGFTVFCVLVLSEEL